MTFDITEGISGGDEGESHEGLCTSIYTSVDEQALIDSDGTFEAGVKSHAEWGANVLDADYEIEYNLDYPRDVTVEVTFIGIEPDFPEHVQSVRSMLESSINELAMMATDGVFE